MHPIKLAATNKVLSAQGGLYVVNALLAKADLNNIISKHLPALKMGSSKSVQKFRHLVLGFAAGAECLDDLEVLAEDQAFAEICAKPYSAKAYGDFLRSFTALQCKELNRCLATLSFKLRAQLFPEQRSITIDFDSTANQQYGKKMEGVEVNYKGLLCLDTFQAFDEHGLQYWHDVRPGNTFTATGCVEAVHHIWNSLPKTSYYKRQRRYSRADSGYCNQDFFTACAAKEVGFVVSMRANMLGPLLPQIRSWEPMSSRISFYDGRSCEVAETLYWPKQGRQPLRVVVLRARRKEQPGVLFPHHEAFDHYAWISNIGEHEMSAEKLLLFYRGRGQAENYIRELKYGFDLKHYPCLKLTANKAYGLIAAFAYTLLRFMALRRNPAKPCYSKKLRNYVIHLPVQVVRHARQVLFRFMRHHYEEVQRWLQHIKNMQFGYT